MGVHTFLYRRTGGRLGHTIPGVGGKMLLLDHVGAKSGSKRTSPLLYVKDGADLVVVASKGGYPKHPAWYHNLMANPETKANWYGDVRQVRAREAEGAERQRLWAQMVEANPTYEAYQRRTDRRIPVIVLEPSGV
jgi:F420H(2)-dependent quinone reductase